MATLLNESPVVLPVHRRILAFAFLGWIFDFYDLMLLSFVIASTSLVTDLHLTRYDTSVLLGTSLAFSAIGGIIGGALADRYGRKPMLMAAILIYSAGTLVSGLVTGMSTLLIARAITGIGIGAEWGVAHALVGETVPPHVRGRFGSYLQSGAVFGRFFATLVGNSLAPWIGWRWTFIWSALPALIVVVIRSQMPESDAWLRHTEQAEKPTSWFDEVGQMLGPRLRGVTTIAFSLVVFQMGTFWFKSIWLPTYFTTVRGLSLAASSQLFFTEQFGALMGYLTNGYLSDTLGRRPAFFLLSLSKAVGIVLLTVAWSSIADSPALLTAVMLLVGFGDGNWGGVGPIINEVFPTSVRATALGIIYNVSRGMQVLAPIIIAVVATRFGFGAGIALAAPFALCAGLIVWLLPETKGVRITASTPDPAAQR